MGVFGDRTFRGRIVGLFKGSVKYTATYVFELVLVYLVIKTFEKNAEIV